MCEEETGVCTECYADTNDRAYTLEPGRAPKDCDWELIKPTCHQGQYYKSSTNTCEDCGKNCQECADENGYCNQCVPDRGDTMYFVGLNGKDCDAQTIKPTCASNEYVNGNNKCAPCAQNCESCNDGMGICNRCAFGYEVQAGIPTNC